MTCFSDIAENLNLKINGKRVSESEIIEYIKTNGLKSLEASFQEGAIKEVGYNGVQWTELLHVCIGILSKLNSTISCRENSITLTKLEEALMWQNKRTENRIKRGVEGTQNN